MSDTYRVRARDEARVTVAVCDEYGEAAQFTMSRDQARRMAGQIRRVVASQAREARKAADQSRREAQARATWSHHAVRGQDGEAS